MEVLERINNFLEFHKTNSPEQQRLQGARCMDCGVPFCQAGMSIAGMTSGCPLHNLVPELNNLVSQGNLEQAYNRLSQTHSFPEFTSRVCPALCEAACTCSQHTGSVTTKANERAVIEYAFAHNLVKAQPPKNRTGKKAAVIGSGPAGLAAAQSLNMRGHLVTVFERNDRPGGLLRYGIPNMKLDKEIIDRRIALMEKAGITFCCNTNVGVDITFAQLKQEYDCIILACGASKARDVQVPGRDAQGIYFAVDFLSGVTKTLLDSRFETIPYEMAKDKHVLIVGGGDTGNDCIGTVIRLGAKSVMQLEINPMPPATRAASNPWPEWPRVLKTDYGQEEAIAVFGKDPREYQTTVKEFKKDADGHITGAVLIKLEPKLDEKTKRSIMVPIEGTEKEVPADLVLIAAGFVGAESYIVESAGVECDARNNVKTAKDAYETSVEGVFTAGDMHRGQSLVVWAIAEGRACAKAADEYLMGYTNL